VDILDARTLAVTYYVYFMLKNINGRNICHHICRVEIKHSVKFTMKMHYQNEFSSFNSNVMVNSPEGFVYEYHGCVATYWG
jgi:hypothetical protein